ncbi:MAG: hypothetical protein ACRDH5_00985 [bacterium]
MRRELSYTGVWLAARVLVVPPFIGSSALLMRHLAYLKGRRAIVVMNDERSFKGTVEDHDEHWVLLRDVFEGSAVNAKGWEEVTIHTGFLSKRFTARGVLSEQEPGELVRMKDVLIHLDGVLRIWEWEPENLTKPEHVELDSSKRVF